CVDDVAALVVVEVVQADAEEVVEVSKRIDPARSKVCGKDLGRQFDFILEAPARLRSFEPLDQRRITANAPHRRFEKVEHLIGGVLDKAPKISQRTDPVAVMARGHALAV